MRSPVCDGAQIGLRLKLMHHSNAATSMNVYGNAALKAKRKGEFKGRSDGDSSIEAPALTSGGGFKDCGVVWGSVVHFESVSC